MLKYFIKIIQNKFKNNKFLYIVVPKQYNNTIIKINKKCFPNNINELYISSYGLYTIITLNNIEINFYIHPSWIFSIRGYI